jgi:hypothetical protein
MNIPFIKILLFILLIKNSILYVGYFYFKKKKFYVEINKLKKSAIYRKKKKNKFINNKYF